VFCYAQRCSITIRWVALGVCSRAVPFVRDSRGFLSVLAWVSMMSRTLGTAFDSFVKPGLKTEVLRSL